MPSIGFSYNQKGIVATVRLKSPISTAVQRFLSTGPVACLPLWSDYASIVWSVPIPHVDELLSRQESDFVQTLVEALGYQLKNHSLTEETLENSALPEIVEIVGKRAAFPLRFGHATQYYGKRVVLVGDAAHTIHPLAGQGVNLGFADVTALCNIIGKEIECGYEIGNETSLQQYQSARMLSNLQMMAGVDGIKRVFDTTFQPFVAARRMGMVIINQVPYVKSFFMGRAMEGTFESLQYALVNEHKSQA